MSVDMTQLVTTIKRLVLKNKNGKPGLLAIIFLTKIGSRSVKLLSVSKENYEKKLGKTVSDPDFVRALDKLELDEARRLNVNQAKTNLHEQYQNLVKEEHQLCKIII